MHYYNACNSSYLSMFGNQYKTSTVEGQSAIDTVTTVESPLYSVSKDLQRI